MKNSRLNPIYWGKTTRCNPKFQNTLHHLKIWACFVCLCRKSGEEVDDNMDTVDVENTDAEGARRFDEGWEAERVIGATDVGEELRFLIKWKGMNSQNFVSNKVARKWIPQMLIKFYEDHTQWFD